MNRPKLDDFTPKNNVNSDFEKYSLSTLLNYSIELDEYCDELERKLEGKEFKDKWVRALCSDYQKLRDCRNELCLMCGKYKEEHKGACDGCRWKEWCLKDD